MFWFDIGSVKPVYKSPGGFRHPVLGIGTFYLTNSGQSLCKNRMCIGPVPFNRRLSSDPGNGEGRTGWYTVRSQER